MFEIFPLVICQCGRRMYPALTEALPHAVHRTTFQCAECSAEHVKVLAAIELKAAC